MICYENCPHCNADISFKVSAYMDCGDVCYDLEIEDIFEKEEDEENIETGLLENEAGDICCSKCGKVIEISVSTNVEIEAKTK